MKNLLTKTLFISLLFSAVAPIQAVGSDIQASEVGITVFEADAQAAAQAAYEAILAEMSKKREQLKEQIAQTVEELFDPVIEAITDSRKAKGAKQLMEQLTKSITESVDIQAAKTKQLIKATQKGAMKAGKSITGSIANRLMAVNRRDDSAIAAKKGNNAVGGSHRVAKLVKHFKTTGGSGLTNGTTASKMCSVEAPASAGLRAQASGFWKGAKSWVTKGANIACNWVAEHKSYSACAVGAVAASYGLYRACKSKSFKEKATRLFDKAKGKAIRLVWNIGSA